MGYQLLLAKHPLNQFNVGAFNFVRFGGVVALGWATIAVTGGQTRIARDDRRWLVLVAVIGFCGYVFGFSLGLAYTSAFSASLLLALVPLWVGIFTSALARKPPPRASLLALGLAAAGTALFVGTRTSISLGWGDAISLVVALNSSHPRSDIDRAIAPPARLASRFPRQMVGHDLGHH